ncbi:RNA polymerase 2 mediator complex component [Paraphoma chrysanthemicola]|uniref:RNA polymerase 2 mediator complex component n=1 Tax=Paraphoma chrysanthemicola TaxID=798071 RepID=A0A8K0QU94_9PLEO|nr:RNA polymerase 2 mediator complex component [Paraphoma chrysanthemicola]
MPKTAESNACSACAKSKRKCGRQMPTCVRCADRGIRCVYPYSTREAPSSLRLLLPEPESGSIPTADDGQLGEGAVTSFSIGTDHIPAESLSLEMSFPLMYNESSTSSALMQMPIGHISDADWFLAPETWRMTHVLDNMATVPIGIPKMKDYILLLQSWFRRWVTHGSNPFVHSHLYKANFPACVQVAYATLASYIHRTPENTDIILRIVADRSAKLLQEHGAVPTRNGTESWADEGPTEIDLFTQLSRLHALMVYQIIGLFDGDIRSRHVAEGQMSVQDTWANILFQAASKSLTNTRDAGTQLIGSLPRPTTNLQQRWYLWILSESIRRTWLIASSMFSIYSALQQRWSVCPGSIMYSNRKGMWCAESSTDWDKLCSKGGAASLQRFACSRLPYEADPDDIDEFGDAMLNMTVHEEILEEWKSRNR